MTFAWTWNAATRRLTVVCTGLTPAASYGLFVEGYLSSGLTQTDWIAAGGGGGLTLELTDVDYLGPGNMFAAYVKDQATETVLDANVFTAESSSSGDGVTASFSHDGATNYSVQVLTELGVDYTLWVFPATPGVIGFGTTTWTGNGTLETKTADTTANPIAGGESVRAILTSPSGSAYKVMAHGLQVQGTAGPAAGTNPGGGTFDGSLAGPVEEPEGSWVFSYDGAAVAVAHGSGLVPGRVYLFGTDSSIGPVVGTADGSGNVTLTQAVVDPSGSGYGPGFYAWVTGGPLGNAGSFFGGVGKAATIFEYGTPSAGGAGLAGVTWTFDGVEFGTVSIPTVMGVEYDINSVVGGVDDIDGPITGDGTVMTIHWKIRQPPPNVDNSNLSSQYVVAMFNNTVFEDLSVHQFEYAEAFPVVRPIVLVESPPWRFTVHDLDLQTVTILDRLALNRTVTYALNLPALATLDVPSDNPEVNITQAGSPFVSGGNKILMGFRREGAGSAPRPLGYDPNAPWVPRFGGIIAPLGREARVDQPWTHISASDPWGYWGSRPVVTALGVLPGRGGLKYVAKRGNVIALDLFTNSLAAHGNLYVDFGQTAFYGGTIEATDPIGTAPDGMVFDQGLSLGEALKKLTDTGSMDIVLRTIYDPINRPGIIAEVSIYNQAGSKRNAAIFAWDMPSHSLNGIDLLHDYTQIANKVALWASAANMPVQVESNPTSIAKYGQWWLLQSIQGQASIAAADLLALSKLALLKDGKDTLTIDPHPERAPVPINGYFLGDEVPVYASDDFGEVLDAGSVVDGAWNGLRRIYSIPLDIADDEVETVTQLLLSSS